VIRVTAGGTAGRLFGVCGLKHAGECIKYERRCHAETCDAKRSAYDRACGWIAVTNAACAGIFLVMPTPDAILATLDALAEGFEFPGFNNMNYEFADSRLHCFRGAAGWALVIEELVDWPGADGLMTIIFAIGDIRGESLTTATPISRLEQDDEGHVIIPDVVRVRGSEVRVQRKSLQSALANHEIEPQFALLLQLIGSHRDALFCTRSEIADRVAIGLESILMLDDWSHPDVYGGPQPSESETFRQLAEVLASGERQRYAPTEPPKNRDWKMWRDSK
jgi:hypothetical protein